MSKQPVYGVHSEVGVLRKVLVCSPGTAHMRLTPRNKDDLLFDDLMWVDNAKRDHFDFVNKMRDRGVEVVEMHQMLAETVALPEARKWILDHQVTANEVGLDVMADVRAYLDSLSPPDLANALIGGLDKSIALQPLSVQGSTGLNVAAGIGSISLKHTR